MEWNGVEWKEKIGMEYAMTQVWNVMVVLILTLLSWDIMARVQHVHFRAAKLSVCKMR